MSLAGPQQTLDYSHSLSVYSDRAPHYLCITMGAYRIDQKRVSRAW